MVQYPYPYEEYLHEKEKRQALLRGAEGPGGSGKAGQRGGTGSGADSAGAANGKGRTLQSAPTIADVFDKKTYYSPGKIKSRLTRQREKYEAQIAESEQRAAELKLRMMDPALASDYEKLMELQTELDAQEQNQESLLERLLETETALEELE